MAFVLRSEVHTSLRFALSFATSCSLSDAGTRGSFSPCTTSNGLRIMPALVSGDIRFR